MYGPQRQTLNFCHIEQINSLTFHYRELSRQVTSLLGVIGSNVVAQLRSLNNRIGESVEGLESDLARNERAPFEAKIEYYRQELEELRGMYNELLVILHGPETPTEPAPGQNATSTPGTSTSSNY